jgi:tRNA-splicing ligase RtcB (3'-phosphate/5'-hydroxy nucleic acid ligase)
MSRTRRCKRWHGRQVSTNCAPRHPDPLRSMRGIAEEAPGAYKDVDDVAEATERAGLAKRVASLRPLVCIKG